jgi:hypothetical protein
MALASTTTHYGAEIDPAAPPARYHPRSLSVHSKRRFARHRRDEYLGQIAGSPNPWQVAAIESLVRREWLALVAERADDLDTALRADREYQKLADSFRRSLTPPAAQPAPPSLADLFRRGASVDAA